MQRRFELGAPQRATRDSPTLGLESRTREPESSPPASDTFQVGPWDMGNAQAERTEQKVDAACAGWSFSLGSFEHLLSPAMRARRDGGPFACWYTSASLAKAFVPIAAPRRAAPFRTPQVLFTVGIEWRKGSLPGPPDRTSSLRDRDFRFCNVECPRLLYRSSSPEADCLQAWFAFGSADAPWSYPQLLRRSAPSTSLSKRFLRLVRPRN